MKLGVFLNSQHAATDDPRRRFDEMVEQVRLMRQLGFDSVWGGEHHITDGYHYFPLLPLMQRLAAEVDGTMEIGTNIVLLPLHNPIEMAEIGAFLDVISGGKFNLGVGLGYRSEEFDMFRVPIKQRVGRMVEGVEIIRRLWREDNVTHAGKYWQFENVTIRPRPLQQPPPVLIAAQVDAAVERAATIGDGWCMVSTPRVGDMAKHIDLYTSKRQEAELEPAAHMVRLYEVCCAENEETALRCAAPYLIEKYAAYASWGLPGLSFDPEDSPEEQLRKLAIDRFAVGSPEQVVEAILAQHRIGVNHLTMRTSWPGMPQGDILASLEMIGTKVLPEVRRRIASGEV